MSRHRVEIVDLDVNPESMASFLLIYIHMSQGA